MKDNRYYVYLYRDPRSGEPVYVGKGRGGRAASHARRAGKSKTKSARLSRFILARRAEGYEPVYEIVEYFDTEEEAFQREIELIEKYGRWGTNTGILFNHDPGGRGGVGYKKSEEKRLAQAAIARGIMNRLHADPEFKAKLDRSRKAMHADPEFKKNLTESFVRRKETEEFKERSAAGLERYYSDPRTRASRSERLRKLHDDPEFARARDERASALLRKLHDDPEFVRKRDIRAVENAKRMNADPEYIRRRSEMLRARNSDPAFIEKCRLGREARRAARDT